MNNNFKKYLLCICSVCITGICSNSFGAGSLNVPQIQTTKLQFPDEDNLLASNEALGVKILRESFDKKQTTKISNADAALAMGTPGVITATRLNIRSGPSLRSGVIGILSKGVEISVTDRKGKNKEWLEIIWPADFPVWIEKRNIEITTGKSGKVIRTSSVYSLGTPQSPVVGKMKSGDELEIVGEAADWCKVKAPQTARAFVYGKYIQLKAAFKLLNKKESVSKAAGKVIEDMPTLVDSKSESVSEKKAPRVVKRMEAKAPPEPVAIKDEVNVQSTASAPAAPKVFRLQRRRHAFGPQWGAGTVKVFQGTLVASENQVDGTVYRLVGGGRTLCWLKDTGEGELEGFVGCRVEVFGRTMGSTWSQGSPLLESSAVQLLE